MPEEQFGLPERQLGRYGVEFRLTLIAAGSAVGVMAFIATRTMSSWSGLAFFAALMVSGWTVLLFLHGRAAEVRQRRVDGLRRVRNFGERLVIYDRETAFYADWYFRLRLQEELQRCQRFGTTCALILVEATEGRLSPEREKELFDSMGSSFRETDLVAHLGSLRFVVLLPNIDAENAAQARQRLLDKLPAGEIEAGIANYPDDGSDWRELLTAAGASSTDFYGTPTKVWSADSTSRFARHSDSISV